MHCGDQRHLGLCLGYVPALAYGSCRVSDQGTTLRASDLHNARATILNPFNIRYQLVERFRTFFATCMSSENLLINLLALNAHFCNSPMSMNRRYADKLLVEKKMIWLRRKAVMQLYCHHCSKYENNSGQFQILIGMKLKWWLNLSVLHDPGLAWCIPFNKWVDFFPCVNTYVCIILYGTNVSE